MGRSGWLSHAGVLGPPNEELNLTGGLRQQLARGARELHLIESAGRLTPARYADASASYDV